MAYRRATLVASNDSEMETLLRLRARAPSGIYQVSIRRMDEECGETIEEVGWFQIMPDGSVDIGTPG